MRKLEDSGEDSEAWHQELDRMAKTYSPNTEYEEPCRVSI